MAYAENDKLFAGPLWLDTVNVPYEDSVDVIMDFTESGFGGMPFFHCHLLNHEDQGMMARSLFQ
jgi:FtsP/CotA-like multicopper oxidase with cupredoxin domain